MFRPRPAYPLRPARLARPAQSSWRRAGVLTLAAATAVAVAACGGDAEEEAANAAPSLKAADELTEPSSPVTITYVGAAYAAEDLEPVFAAFTEAHPNITVEYESVPFDELNNVLQVRLDGDAGDIDVFDADMPRVAAYESRGYLTDLTPTFGDIGDQVDAASIDASTVDGLLVAMPLQTSSQLLYYNRALLEAAGIEPPSADPAERPTWEQVSADGAKAQAAGATWGLVFDQLDRYYQLQPMAESLGGGNGATGDGNLEPAVNTEEWVTAFEWYGKQYADGISPRGVTAAETPELFGSGQAAFFAGGPWWAPGFVENTELDFGVAPYPAFEGGDPVTPTGAWSLGLNKKTANLDASLIFMRFMGLDGDGFSQYVENIAIPPANTAGSEKYFEQATFSTPQMAGAREILANEISETAVTRVKTVGYIEFEDIMGKTFADIINGTPAQDALDKANDDLTTTWAKYQ